MKSGSQSDSQEDGRSSGQDSHGRIPYEDHAIPFTERQIRLGKFTATIWAWGALVMVLLTCVFHTLALATTEWVKVENMNAKPTSYIYSGLWQDCFQNSRCIYSRIDQTSDALRTCQAFAIFVSLLLAVVTCLIAIYIIAEAGIRDARLVLWSVGGRAITVFMFLIIVCVYASHWSDGAFSDAEKYSGTLGYSFALECTAVATEALGTVFSVMEMKVILSTIEE